MSQTLIHLVRHGAVHNPRGLLYGRLPGFRLSDAGEAMARADADWLAQRPTPVTRIIASPLLRARQTAAPIAARCGLGIDLDARLIEAANRIEGLAPAMSTFINPARWALVCNPFRPSWGEPYREIAHRMCAAIDDARRRGEGSRIVIVSHQLPIWIARRELTGQRLWHDPRRRECDLASITTLDYDGERLAHLSYDTPAAGIAGVPVA